MGLWKSEQTVQKGIFICFFIFKSKSLRLFSEAALAENETTEPLPPTRVKR